MVFACPNHALLISLFQVQVHELFHHRLSFCSDAFVKEELILYLGYGGTFDGCGVGDDGVQIKLFMVYLVLYAQLLIFLQNFFKFAYAVMYSLHILASSFGRFCTRRAKLKSVLKECPGTAIVGYAVTLRVRGIVGYLLATIHFALLGIDGMDVG